VIAILVPKGRGRLTQLQGLGQDSSQTRLLEGSHSSKRQIGNTTQDRRTCAQSEETTLHRVLAGGGGVNSRAYRPGTLTLSPVRGEVGRGVSSRRSPWTSAKQITTWVRIIALLRETWPGCQRWVTAVRSTITNTSKRSAWSGCRSSGDGAMTGVMSAVHSQTGS